ncbi:hypothetical protein K501DRAFT_303236 [Backusella circina FSU 941]|nr:hypothetical protein K501DRAFT_303236 [Backusella circina FSU 941]
MKGCPQQDKEQRQDKNEKYLQKRKHRIASRSNQEKNKRLISKPCCKHQIITKSKEISKEQIIRLIDYVENSNMTVHKASGKANMSGTTGANYYKAYKDDLEGNIPVPKSLFNRKRSAFMDEQIKLLIGYIVNDKMTILAA